MTEFKINTSGGYSLCFHSKAKRNGLKYYAVTLKAPNAQATIDVYEHPNTDSMSGFFQQMADNWRGLQEALNWESMEGELRLSAASNSTGHSCLTATVYSNSRHEPPFFELRVEYIVEAGQLVKMHTDAKKFFR